MNKSAEHALTQLESFSVTQFKKVLLLYDVPNSEIPQAGTLGEQAIIIVEYARQKEGKQLTHLFEVIDRCVLSSKNVSTITSPKIPSVVSNQADIQTPTKQQDWIEHSYEPMFDPILKK